MQGEMDVPRSGDPKPVERDAVVGAIVFVVVSLLLIATASLAPASHASSGPRPAVTGAER
jgi:hypothetical protein